MPFKLTWEREEITYEEEEKETTFLPYEQIGPILGKVENQIFIPLSEKEAKARLSYFNLHYKQGKHSLKETPFLPSDLPELRKIHPYFSDALDFQGEI